ncbi:MAG: WbuC family cupin fold metalloprotein [Verrucomicrobiales bacterium]|nr:WbuC family cupin fold metalloprotein [Verrucomicrobiales bacterium]
MTLAMTNPTGPVFELTAALCAEGLALSRRSPRRRMLLPIHRHQDDLVQRMVNFLQPGTYIQAHQHPRDCASETILVTSGSLGFVTFDAAGEVLTTSRLSVGDLIDIEARVWHGVLALAPDTIILEIKRGPYDDQDKVFADWAPPENADDAPAYLKWLLSLFPEGGYRLRDESGQ